MSSNRRHVGRIRPATVDSKLDVSEDVREAMFWLCVHGITALRTLEGVVTLGDRSDPGGRPPLALSQRSRPLAPLPMTCANRARSEEGLICWVELDCAKARTAEGAIVNSGARLAHQRAHCCSNARTHGRCTMRPIPGPALVRCDV